MTLAVKFWGVRGSIACPSPDHVVYGGNTSCLEIFAGDERIILDAGTGIRGLGQEFIRDGVKRGTLLLTHSHWDHINGFPFFAPMFMPSYEFGIYAGHLYNTGGIENVLSSQMANPLFPVPLEALQAKLRFVDFKAGEDWDHGNGVKIVTMPLNHPNGATGYRIEFEGRSICYVTADPLAGGCADGFAFGMLRRKRGEDHAARYRECFLNSAVWHAAFRRFRIGRFCR
jgi:phosphoribosyl 1,2-cyclic phosphodiesterase